MLLGSPFQLTAAMLPQEPHLAPGAKDWPTYLANPQRTAASDEQILSIANAGTLNKLWAFKTGGIIAASATVVNGVVYVGSWDGYEYALDAVTGAMKWKTFLGVTNGFSYCNPPAPGISSAAAIQKGVVYVGGGDSYWYALNASTGVVLWSVFTGDNSATGGHYNWSSPLLYNGYAYIGIASLGDCPLVQGQLLKVSLSTHQVVKTLNMVPNGQVGGGIWTSPSIDTATNTIFVATGTESDPSQQYAQALVAIDATTLTIKSSWKLPESQAVADSDFGTTPILFTDSAGDQLVEAINKNGYAYAFNRNDLAAGPVWQALVAIGGICPTCGGSSVSSSTSGGGRLYLSGEDTTMNGVGYPGSIRAADPATGKFLWQDGLSGPVIAALAYDNGLVVVAAGPMVEVLNASNGAKLFTYQTGGTIYGAPGISNGEIFVGSVDGNLYAFGLRSASTPPPDPNCPNGWTCQDVGGSTPAGSETVSNGVWNISAGGAGLAGTSDQFRQMTQTPGGDLQVTARVTAQQAASTISQAGLIVRQTSDPGSPYYGVFITPNNGVVVQYRVAFGGATIQANTANRGALPLYLEIQRVGDTFLAATSTDGTNYILIPGDTVTLTMPTAVLAGLTVSSAVQGTAGTAIIQNVTIGAPGTPPALAPSASPCPSSWSCADVGNPLVVGDQTLSNGVWTVKGAGGDIWGTQDQFHFIWQSLTADGTVSAHITSQSTTDPWAKAGVMLRQNTTAASIYYAMFVTPSNGIVVQYRTAQGLTGAMLANPAGAAPAYLEVARSGNAFTAYTSSDGATWVPVSGTTVTMNVTGAMLAGLAVTSHNSGALGTATFAMVHIGTSVPTPPNVCPTGWNCADIGNTLPGGQALSNGVWTVGGAGGDIWSTSDQFHYVWQPVAGDSAVSARVTSQSTTDPWAKAGVMLRQSTAVGGAEYSAFVTPGNGIAVQYRPSSGAPSVQLADLIGTVPAYLQVARSGNTFTAYTSANGTTWIPIAGTTVTISMSGTVLAGMAVTSHNAGVVGTAIFDTVTITPSAPTPPGACPTNWNCGDIGAPALAGSQTLNNGVWTVQGAGGDIWGTADQFHYLWLSLTGDGTVSAHVTSQSTTDPWAKAGVMLRQGTNAGDAYYAIFVTPGDGIVVQYRPSPGASAINLVSITGAVPAYLRVGRAGNTFAAYISIDGTTWMAVVGSNVTLTLNSTLLAGMAVTSHNAGTLCTATFDTVSIQ